MVVLWGWVVQHYEYSVSVISIYAQDMYTYVIIWSYVYWVYIYICINIYFLPFPCMPNGSNQHLPGCHYQQDGWRSWLTGASAIAGETSRRAKKYRSWVQFFDKNEFIWERSVSKIFQKSIGGKIYRLRCWLRCAMVQEYQSISCTVPDGVNPR